MQDFILPSFILFLSFSFFKETSHFILIFAPLFPFPQLFSKLFLGFFCHVKCLPMWGYSSIYLTWRFWSSKICDLMPVISFRKLFAIITSNISFVPFFFCNSHFTSFTFYKCPTVPGYSVPSFSSFFFPVCLSILDISVAISLITKFFSQLCQFLDEPIKDIFHFLYSHFYF